MRGAWGPADPAPGLLAAGGDLSVATLERAYRHGIFPWFSGDQPILWWSPDPRAVLWPDDLHVSRSLNRTLQRSGLELRIDSAFDAVHHSRKLNGSGAVVEDGRGASSLLGATRSMRALSKMSKTEADALGVGAEYRTLFRFSDIASNMTPPSADEPKAKKKGIRIINAARGALIRNMPASATA